MSSPYRQFAGSTIERWVFDGEDPNLRRSWPTMAVTGRLEHVLRYGDPTEQNRFAAASVLEAYRMLLDPSMTTERAISELRALRRLEKGGGA